MRKIRFSVLILFSSIFLLAGCTCKILDLEKIKTQLVKVDDCTLGYKTFGQGYPLVMITGYSATMDMWDARVLSKLARRYKVIIFDNRGMGASTASNKEFSIKLFADDTAGLFKALNIKQANVLGYSMGASIALEFTLKYPEMANKLILYAGNCGGKEPVSPTPENMQKLIDTSGTPEERGKRLLRLLLPEQWLKDNPDPAKYLPKITETSSMVIIDRQTKALTTWEGCYSRLPDIIQPVLLITGTEDVVTPAENSLILANRIPLAWLAQIKGGGHGLMYQSPRKFSKVILAFLED
ncbi:MAG: alpha/beta hydrolase [Candidatus Omnitrophota bacterium]